LALNLQQERDHYLRCAEFADKEALILRYKFNDPVCAKIWETGAQNHRDWADYLGAKINAGK
jgi:hypothetical protein